MKTSRLFLVLLLFVRTAAATDFFVDVNGNDQTGDGSHKNPWRTIAFAAKQIPANQGHTLRISRGTFYENSSIEVPLRTNIEGAGMEATIIKAAQSFFYHPEKPEPAPEKFLIRLVSQEQSDGSQVLHHFTVDGSFKKLHGGIYVHARKNVLIEDVKVQQTNFCGIWILKTSYCTIRNVTLVNCAWGNTDWCSGAFQLAYIDHVDVDRLSIDEDKGYGIKTLGQGKDHVIRHLKLHDSKISVNPKGLWQNGKAPNISIELWANSFPESEIYNCRVDNHISLVNCDHSLPPSGKTFRIHHNLIDLKARAKDQGYGMELTIHDAEVDHNVFKGGMWGISNWAQQKENWRIHHNVFYELDNVNPGSIINSYKGNLKHVAIYNNTVEMSGKSTINFLECNNGGMSEDVKIQNNLIINSNTAYSHYPNRFISLENGAKIKSLVVENNLLFNLPVGDVPGTFRNNILGEPKIARTGNRPFPFYTPVAGSPLVNAGCKVDVLFQGSAPDIGAYESKPKF